MEKYSYLSRPNLEYIETLYQNFRTNPESIDQDWRLFFQGVDFAQNLSGRLQTDSGFSSKELDVFRLINTYRDYGHFEANLNPLASGTKSFPELSLFQFNLAEGDLDSKFEIGAMIGRPGATLRDIILHLRNCYCRTIAVQVAEAMPTVRNWFINEFEKNMETFKLSNDEKKPVFTQLAKTEAFEKFLNTRYVGKKRFSIEGSDALIPMLERLTAKGAEGDLEELVVGMAHRGRLNVLVNFLEKPVDSIFAEFEYVRDEFNSFFDGDVKYHLGFSANKKTATRSVHLSLAYNPSHLETVDPIALGMTRAKQRRRKDTSERKKVIPVLIHGDAAFAGQGVVAGNAVLREGKVRGRNIVLAVVGRQVAGDIRVIVGVDDGDGLAAATVRSAGE